MNNTYLNDAFFSRLEALALEGYHLCCYLLCFFVFILRDYNVDLIALGTLAPEVFALAVFIVAYYCVCSFENVCTGAVILLKLDNTAAGVLVFKTENIFNSGTAEAINTLVIIANHTDILISTGK